MLSLRKENLSAYLGLVLITEEVSMCLQGLTQGSRDPSLTQGVSPPDPFASQTTDTGQGGNTRALTEGPHLPG